MEDLNKIKIIILIFQFNAEKSLKQQTKKVFSLSRTVQFFITKNWSKVQQLY